MDFDHQQRGKARDHGRATRQQTLLVREYVALTAIPTFFPLLNADMSNWNWGLLFSTFFRFLLSSLVSILENPSCVMISILEADLDTWGEAEGFLFAPGEDDMLDVCRATRLVDWKVLLDRR